MDGGVFDPMELGKLQAVTTKKAPSRPGIFVRVYKDVSNEIPKNHWDVFRSQGISPVNAVYVGQTTVWAARARDHEKHMQDGNALHYRLGRNAKEWKMIPIIFFNVSLPSERDAQISILRALSIPNILQPSNPNVASLGVSSVLAAAELTMVALFHSWNPILLGSEFNQAATASHLACFRSAKTFNSIANNVAERENWKPESTIGLNWNTPMVEDRTQKETLWCSWSDEEKRVTVFRCRRPIEVRLKKNGIDIHSSGVRLGGVLGVGTDSHAGFDIDLELVKEANFKHGDMVNLVVEFADGEEDHVRMWARFPRIGPNRALELVRSMAISVEWVDGEGKWWSGAITRKQIWTVMKDTGLPNFYGMAMGVATALLQITWTGPNVPAWMTDSSLGRMLIKHFDYDHLNQKLTIQPGKTQTRPWPADYTIQQNTARIRDEISREGWTKTTVAVKPHKFVVGGRKACDLCVSQGSVSNIRISTLVKGLSDDADKRLSDNALHGKGLRL